MIRAGRNRNKLRLKFIVTSKYGFIIVPHVFQDENGEIIKILWYSSAKTSCTEYSALITGDQLVDILKKIEGHQRKEVRVQL